jgi:hypothetical protein
LKVEGDKVDGVESTNSASLGQPGVRARKCVREDRVAEGVPAPRGKRFEVRGLGGNSPMYSMVFEGVRRRYLSTKDST